MDINALNCDEDLYVRLLVMEHANVCSGIVLRDAILTCPEFANASTAMALAVASTSTSVHTIAASFPPL